MTLDFCRSSRMPINISLNVPEDIMLAIAQAGGDVAYAGACRACREYFINHPVLLYNAVKAAAGALTLRHMMELALQHGNSAASAFTIARVRVIPRQTPTLTWRALSCRRWQRTTPSSRSCSSTLSSRMRCLMRCMMPWCAPARRGVRGACV